MRFGKLFFVITLFALISMAMLVGGCSDDKTTTAAVADNGYTAVQSEFALYTDSLTAQINNNLAVFHSLDVIDSSVVAAYSPVNPDSAVSVNGWQVVYASDLVAGYTIYLVDSLQFKTAGVVHATANGADQMQVIRHWGVENADTTVTYRNADVTSSFTFTGLKGADVTVNGSRNTTVQTKVVGAQSTVKRSYAINMVVTNLVVPNDGAYCPQSGTVTGTIVQTVDNGSVPVTTSWQYDVSVDTGVLTGDVTAGAWQATVTRNMCQ